MTQRHLTITLQRAWRAALRDAGKRARGRGCQGEIAIRELARRVGRDVRRVHEDVQVLIELGLVERDAAGGVACPFDEVHIDMRMQAERAHAV